MKKLSNYNNDQKEQSINQKESLFLPDFCSLQMVFSVIIIAELLAFILTLAPLEMTQQRWNNLAIISLFIQWNGLMCSGSLCLLRPFIKNYSQEVIAISSYILLLLTIALLSEITFYIIDRYAITDIIATASRAEFLLHNLLIGGIISALALRYFYIQHQWRIKVEAESNNRLQLLYAKIRPHFLFNSLNSIASLTRSRPDVAEKITEDLAALFRIIIRDDKALIRWSREKQLSQYYINIEKQRLGKRLKIQWQTDSIPDNALIPALLLQPLLENAIFHGIEPVVEGGSIIISGDFDNKKFTITITNSNSKNVLHREGNQIALQNIKERLASHFASRASIRCYEKDNDYCVVVILPYEKMSN